MKTILGISLGIIVGIFAAGLYAAPPPTPVLPPPGGTIAPGPIGGQIAPGPGGRLMPGSIISQAPVAGPPVNPMIPGGSLFIGSNGVIGNPPLNRAITAPNSPLNATAPAGGAISNRGVGGVVNQSVIVAGGISNSPAGGVILGTRPVGGSAGGVIVAGGGTPGGTISASTNSTFTPKAVIVTGGSGH